MKNIKKTLAIICVIVMIISSSAINGGHREAKSMSVTDFLNTVGPMATADMQRTGILASLTMAQAILESGWGTSELATQANALFGMKATNWSGATYWYNGTSWRAYGGWQESVNDHGNHLSTMSRYANLVGETDYVTACYNVAADGYCPDEGYAENLIKLIETYNLTQFDVYSSLTLDGYSAANLGEDFYARIRQTSTGLYLTDKDYNVFASKETNGADQLWHFRRQTNGSYTISMDASGCFMDVTAANYNHGTNVQTCEGNNSLAQKFFIYYILGNFYFKCVASDIVFDVDSASNNLQIFGTSSFYNEPDRGEFKARSFEIISPCLSDGTWHEDYGDSFTAYIRNMSTGKLLTADENRVVGTDPIFSEAQKWNIKKNQYGGYEIISALTGEAFDIAGAALDSGTPVQFYQPNHSKAQTFYFIKRHGGMYIKPAYTTSVLDMDSQTGHVHIYPWADLDLQKSAQVFELITEQSYNGDKPAYLGTSFDAYILNKCCERAVTDNGTVPQCQATDYSANQRWHFEYDAKWNAYKIKGSSGKVIDISNAGWTNGTPLGMWESNDSPAQRFRLYPHSGGYYLVPACTTKIVDVDINNKTSIVLWDSITEATIFFDIVKIGNDGKAPLDLGASFESPIKNTASSLYLTPTNGIVTGNKTEYKWVFTRQENGSYIIKDKSSGKVLDIQGASVLPGAVVQTYESNGTWAQSFFIYSSGDGYILQPAIHHGVINLNSTTKETRIYEISNSTSGKKAQTFELSIAGGGIELKSTSTYAIKGDCVTSVCLRTSVSSFLSQFNDSTLKVYNTSGVAVSGSQLVGSGYVVKASNGESKTIIVVGDTNSDGKLSSTDAMILKNQILFSGSINNNMDLAFDIDASGKCNSTDYVTLKNMLFGK